MAIAGTLEIQMLANVARLQTDLTQAKGMVGSAMSNISRSVEQAKSVLASLGIGLGIGYFANLIKGSIDAMDRLNDLNKTTSIAVEQLAGLKVAAKQAGGDLESVSASINKLSVNMGKDAEKFAALGISAKSPLEAFKQLSDVYISLEDPQQRAAVAAAALGKSWAGAAPLLAEGGKKIGEMVSVGTQLSGVTGEAARQADEFNDKLVLLTGTGGLLARSVSPVLPLLNMLADDMLEAQKKATGLDSEFKPLLETFKALVLVGGYVSFVLKGIGTEAGGMAAQLAALGRGDFAGFSAIRKAMIEDAEKARTEFDAWEQSILNIGTAAGKAGKDLANSPLFEFAGGGIGVSGITTRGAAERAAAFLKENKEVADNDSAYRNLLKTLKEKLLVDHELTEVNKLQLALDALSAKQRETITPKREQELKDLARQVDLNKQAKDGLEAYVKIEEESLALQQEVADVIAKLGDVQTQAILSTEKQIAQIQFETGLLGMNNVERQVAIALRTLENSGIDKQSASYEQLGKRLKEAVGDNARMTEMKAEWERLWSVVENTGKDAFVHLMSDGVGAFKAIGQSIKTAVIDLLYQLTVRRWIINIGTSVSGALGIPGAANAAGSSLNLLSTGASMYGNLGTAGAYAGGYATTAFASEATTAALIESGTVGVAGAGMEAGAMGALAAMGPVGWAALAIGALWAMGAFDGSGGPKREDMFGMRNQTGDWWIGDNNITGHPGQAAYDAHAAFLKRIETTYGRDALNAMDLSKINISAEPGTGYAAIWAEFQRQAIALTKDLVPLAGQVKMTADAAADASAVLAIANQRRQMEIELMEAQGDATGALAERRKDERAALDVSLQALYDQIIAAQDAAEAERQLADIRQSVIDDLATIQRERADTALAAMNDARGAVWDAYDTETQKLEDFAAGFREFSSSLAGARNALTLSPGFGLSPEDRYAEATRQAQDLLRRGQLGDLTAMQGFRDFAGTFLGTSSAYNASGVGFQADKAWILAGFDSLQGVADRQTSIAEEQLSGVRQTVEQLVGIRAGQQSLIDLMAAFTGARDTFQRDANRAGGNLSAGAAGALYDVESQARGQRLSGINALYRNIFGREGDVAGLSFYATSGRSLAQIEAEMRDMRAHGSHAVGLDFVPFDNYRANLHYGERVQTRPEADAERRGASNDPKVVEHLAALVMQNGIALPALISAVNRLEKRMAAIEDNGALAAARR